MRKDRDAATGVRRERNVAKTAQRRSRRQTVSMKYCSCRPPDCRASLITVPQWHSPDRVVNISRQPAKPARPMHRRYRTARAGRGRARPAPPRSRWRSRSARAAVPPRHRTADRTAPAGLPRRCCPTSTVRPLRVRTTSRGRIAVPDTEFSTQPMRTASRTGRSACMIIRASAKNVGGAAHVFFHVQHAAGRLQVEPAGIETDPFSAH